MNLTVPIILFPALYVALILFHYLFNLPAGFIRGIAKTFKWVCFLGIVPALFGGPVGIVFAVLLLIGGLISWAAQGWAGGRVRALAVPEA